MPDTDVAARVMSRYRGRMDGSLRDVEELCEEMMREATTDIGEATFKSQILMVIQKDAKGLRFPVPNVIDMTGLKDAMAQRQESDEAFVGALRCIASDLEAMAVISLGTAKIGEQHLLSLVLEHESTQFPRVWFAKVLGLEEGEDASLGPWKEPKDLHTCTFNTVLRPMQKVLQRN